MLQVSTKKLLLILSFLVVLVIAYFTYFRNYWLPDQVIWDETYHLATTYKYLNHVMFMTGDPPLGKLLIALGEYLFHPNRQFDMYYAVLAPVQIWHVPTGFSFIGIRFFPTLLGMLSAGLFFLLLFKISKNLFLSLLFSSLYLFENATIVQSRAGLPDSSQIFFFFSAMLYFVWLMDKPKIRKLHYFFLGLIVGAIISVRLTGIVFLAVLPFLLWYEKKLLGQKLSFKLIRNKSAIFILGSVLIFLGSYYLQASLGNHVIRQRYYGASPEYQKVLNAHRAPSLQEFPNFIGDYLAYIPFYESTVPKTDQYGSSPYTWPVGGKTINYTWFTDHHTSHYIYLMGNPLIWLVGLVGLIMSITNILRIVLLKKKIPEKNQRLFYLTVFFLVLYLLYMEAMLAVDRVVYLYHYLIPLHLTLLLFTCTFVYFFQKQIANHNKPLYAIVIISICTIIATYYFYSPLTYFQPLTNHQLQQRAILPIWQLKPI